MLLILLLLALGVQQFFAFRSRARAKEAERREIERFERQLSVLSVQMSQPLQEMTSEPDRFVRGELPQEEFKAKTQGWVTALRTVLEEMSTRQPSPSLLEPHSLFQQGVALFLDAARAFDLAADTEEGEFRTRAVDQGKLLMTRAEAIITMASRLLEIEKGKRGIGEPSGILDQPPQPPPIDVPLAPPPLGEIPVPEEPPPSEEVEEPAGDESPAPSG